MGNCARGLGAVAAVLAAVLVPSLGAGAASTTDITLTGHGYGHGHGMGQYGALGYALNSGWSYHQILDHYYGGTVPGQAPNGTTMTVDMTSRDNVDTIVAQQKGELAVAGGSVTCTSGTPCAVRISRIGPSTFKVMQGTACSGGPGGWQVVAPSVNASSVAVTATAGITDSRPDMLQLCETGGTRWLRGDIWAVDAGNSQATVNHVPLEGYVRGVVPRESPASWGNLGGGAGEQALMAQAVAARSYAMADTYTSYAKTCDTTACQVYGGRAFQDFNGNYVDLEGTPQYATSDSAVSQTAGEVRVFSNNAIALTQFSSSTGGYTTGGAFPAVPDDGDAVSSNPNHTWTDTVAVSDIESTYGGPDKGSLVSVTVTGRNGLGDLGGRVTSLTMHFTGGDVSTSGHAFAANFGLRSDWFAITSQPGSGPGSPPPTTTPPPPPVVGYRALTANGTVYSFNGASDYGSFAASAAHTTAVSVGSTPGGYWVLAGNGSVHPFGSGLDHGSLAGKPLNAAPFQLAATPSGNGYWIVAFDGGVFSYGDAHFWGSTGNRRLNKPVVGMAPTSTGKGYWLVASDGGIFAFGDAHFWGSMGGQRLNQPVVAMAASRTGNGYWLIASDGGVFSFGDSTYAGSLPGVGVHETAVALLGGPGNGYLVATSLGHVFGFGMHAQGGPADKGAASPTVALAAAR